MSFSEERISLISLRGDVTTEEKKPLTDNDRTGTVKCNATILEDAIDTVKLGIPIFISRLSYVGMKTTDTALLGHVNAEALSAAALSDLWTMCSGVLIQGRVLGILVGQSVGAGNPKLAGTYLQVSYVILFMVGIFVIACWHMTERVWLAFGESPELSADAGYYARVLSFSIPGLIIFSQLSQFFSGQRIMHPEVTVSMLALALNLIFGLIFVLGVPIPGFDGYGFTACPIVTTVTVYFQIIFFCAVYIKAQKLHQPAWGGWSWGEISRERVVIFSALYFPAALGMASDFWRVAAIGTMAAKLGDIEVGVFNTSYRIMWIALIVVGSIAAAAGIKTSMRLGNGDHKGARQAGYIGIGTSLSFLAVTSVVIFFKIRALGQIFTRDEQFLHVFESTRLPFSITLFLMCLAVAVEQIPYAMGRTSDVFWTGLLASWGAQVPAVYLFTTYWRDDLFALYAGMATGYGVLVLLYGAIVVSSDWKKYSDMARERVEAKA